jgi:hypothetical protein
MAGPGDKEAGVLTQPEVIPVTCDMHGWMRATIHAVDHPFFTVTGDDGSFAISGVPPGEYVVEVWHEAYGTQTKTVTVKPGAIEELGFTVKP